MPNYERFTYHQRVKLKLLQYTKFIIHNPAIDMLMSTLKIKCTTQEHKYEM